MNKKFDPEMPKGPWYMAQITGVFLSDKNELTFKQNAITDDYRKAFMAIPEMLEVIKAARITIDTSDFENDAAGFVVVPTNPMIHLSLAIQKLDEKHGDEVINAKREQ